MRQRQIRTHCTSFHGCEALPASLRKIARAASFSTAQPHNPSTASIYVRLTRPRAVKGAASVELSVSARLLRQRQRAT